MNMIKRKPEELCLFIFGIAIGFMTLSYTQNEDMGIFISETALIARGTHVYTGIFEVKDPLFLWLGGLATWLVDLRAPFLVDAVFVMVSPLVAFKFGRSLQLSRMSSAICGVAFSCALSGTYYQSFRTGTIALVLLVCTLWAAQTKKWTLTGVLSVLVIGFKMAYAPLLLGLCAYFFLRPERLSKILKFVAGAIPTGLVILATLAIRGELSGFMSMVKLNFHYRKIFPQVVGFKPGIAGHIEVLNSNSSSFLILVALLVVSLAVVIKKVFLRQDFVEITALMLTFVGVLIFLLSSAMWFHHLQPLSVLLLSFLLLSSFVLEISRKDNSFFWRSISIIVVVGAFGSLQITGFRFPVRAQIPVRTWLSPQWVQPPEAIFVKNNQSKLLLEKDFARLGPNDDMGLAAFLPIQWKLVCRDYAQYGHETTEMISDMMNCMAKKPNYIFVSPGFFALERASGTYALLKQLSTEMLKTNFRCVPMIEREGAQFCTRTNT